MSQWLRSAARVIIEAMSLSLSDTGVGIYQVWRVKLAPHWLPRCCRHRDGVVSVVLPSVVRSDGQHNRIVLLHQAGTRYSFFVGLLEASSIH